MTNADLLIQGLGVLYSIGFNDGLREAVGRRKEQEGKDAAVAKVLKLLADAGFRIEYPADAKQEA
jgi:hypothetical protein